MQSRTQQLLVLGGFLLVALLVAVGFWQRERLITLVRGPASTASVESFVDSESQVPSNAITSIESQGKKVYVPELYRKCTASTYRKLEFLTTMSQFPAFSQMQVSFGVQTVLTEDGTATEQQTESFLSAPEALIESARRSSIDPQIMATLIELETGGLTNPSQNPRFPLNYPDIPELQDEFTQQVASASTLLRSLIQESEDDYLEHPIDSALAEYLTKKGYTADQTQQMLSGPNGFAKTFQRIFGVSPIACDETLQYQDDSE